MKIKYKLKKALNKTTITNLIIIAMLLVIGVLTINYDSQYVFGSNNAKAIYNGDRSSNNVSLMVNVYWGIEFIEPMLDVFDDYNVSTTFFVGGTFAEKQPELLHEIYKRGHEIGNHGYFHKDHDKLNYEQNYVEINTTHKMVKSILDVDMNLFAPPSGAFNKTTLNVANDLGYKTIMWSKDTIDWRDKDSAVVLSRATKNISGGDLVLMHPTKHTLEALPKILEFYNGRNIVATTVSATIAG